MSNYLEEAHTRVIMGKPGILSIASDEIVPGLWRVSKYTRGNKRRHPGIVYVVRESEHKDREKLAGQVAYSAVVYTVPGLLYQGLAGVVLGKPWPATRDNVPIKEPDGVALKEEYTIVIPVPENASARPSTNQLSVLSWLVTPWNKDQTWVYSVIGAPEDRRVRVWFSTEQVALSTFTVDTSFVVKGGVDQGPPCLSCPKSIFKMLGECDEHPVSCYRSLLERHD